MTSREGPPVADWQDFESADTFPRPFGTYILLQAFARGGMGEVYLAKSGVIAGLEKYCVLKKLRPELTTDPEYVQRFIDEAKVVVQLNHANIAQVFDVGRVGAEFYLAMEYVSGRDLRSLQDRASELRIPLPIGTVIHLVTEVLEALDYAHRRTHPMTGETLNLVHRDVSPQNVLLSFEGEVKLIDFGLAQSNLKAERTQPNIVMGKMAYMAPEQARGDPIDHRADLFAAAVMLYELVAGERFYDGKSAHEIWQVVGRGGYRPKRWAELDDDLRVVLDKAMAANAEARYATCGEMETALADLVHTNYGGKPARSTLRTLVEAIFGEEVTSEREMLTRFGRVTIKSEVAEASRSQSVSLLAEDNLAGVHVARDESVMLDEWGAPITENELPELSPVGRPSVVVTGLSADHPRVNNDDARSITPPTGTQKVGDNLEIERTMKSSRARSSSTMTYAALGTIILLLAAATVWLLRDPPPTPIDQLPPPIVVEQPPLDDEPELGDEPEDPETPDDTLAMRQGRAALADHGYPARPSTWPDNVRAAFELARAASDDERVMLSERFAELAAAAPEYVRPKVTKPIFKPTAKPTPSEAEMVRAIQGCGCKGDVYELMVKSKQNKRLRNDFLRRLRRCYQSCLK